MSEANNKRFWGRYAKVHAFEISRFNKQAYEKMYRFMAQALSPSMEVLELATGTGLIACNIAASAKHITATDYSPKMIATAMKKKVPANVDFSVEDATALSFEDNSFDAVIISNALHIMPEPERALSEIRRVIKPGGLLIAPNFSHGHIGQKTWDLNAAILKFIGFETHSKWTPEEYVAFIAQNGFRVDKWQVLQAGFPLVYLEAHAE